MFRYFFLRMEVEIEGSWLLGRVKNKIGEEIIPYSFRNNMPFDITQHLTVEQRITGYPQDYQEMGTGSIPIVKTEFADVIAELDMSAIQRIPVTIDPLIQGFELLNIMRIIPCVDFERSGRVERYDPISSPSRANGVRCINDLKVISNLDKTYHIFRPKEWSIPIIISETLKNLLEEKEFTGFYVEEL